MLSFIESVCFAERTIDAQCLYGYKGSGLLYEHRMFDVFVHAIWL